MRIALVLHGWPGEAAGGTGLYVESLAGALADQGHAVAVLAPRERMMNGTDPQGVLRWPLDTAPPRTFSEVWAQPRGAASWTSFQRAWRPEVVHIHHLNGLPLSLPQLARDGGARVVLTLHDYAIPCARGQWVDHHLQHCLGPAAARCTECLGLQTQLGPLTSRVNAEASSSPHVQRAGRYVLERLQRHRPARRRLVGARLQAAMGALAAADVLLSPSADLADRLTHSGWPTATVFPLPLTRTISPAPAETDGPVRFLFASSIIQTKGPDRALEAFEQLPTGSATMTFAGPVPNETEAQKFAEHLRSRAKAHAHVRWLGPVPPDRISDLLANHDVLLLPSIWPENSPLIVREATAAGLRVIASKEGGVRELDPEAELIGGSANAIELQRAMARAVDRGRGRRTPLVWPTASDHARDLVSGPYRTG